MKSTAQIAAKKSVLPLLLCLWAVLLSPNSLAQAPQFSNPVDDATRVLDLIEQRLAVMPEVAAWKWRAQQPIADLERERQVLDRSVADAEAIGLDGPSAREFFDVQIQMARAVQSQYFDKWRTENRAPPPGRDLTTQLRPELDAIGRQMLTTVYLASPDLPRALKNGSVLMRLDRLDRISGVDAAQVSRLHAALAAIHIRDAATISRVKQVGVLRVGTTGDYAPFSSEQGAVLSGFDVQLARELASHLGVSVRFVRTSWSKLMDDFRQQRFDIAMSGISVTAERAAQVSFSIAYHVDGKVPITRCSEAAKFASLEQIDRQNVRVIENPGGTNERFARERIKHAALIVHTDNQTIFAELLAGRADVMFTDGIEVDLQVRRHPALCRAMPLPLTQAQKAILLPRSGWESDVNAWLTPRLQSGVVGQDLQRALLEQ
jgi:cyclohexadienyl dehydratase